MKHGHHPTVSNTSGHLAAINPQSTGMPNAAKPEFLRLPQAGQKCWCTGLSRSALNGVILPNEKNEWKPPVRSFVLRQRGAKTGIRLIEYDSLIDFIRSNPATPNPDQNHSTGQSTASHE
jgi:hypothetical protein